MKRKDIRIIMSQFLFNGSFLRGDKEEILLQKKIVRSNKKRRKSFSFFSKHIYKKIFFSINI